MSDQAEADTIVGLLKDVDDKHPFPDGAFHFRMAKAAIVKPDDGDANTPRTVEGIAYSGEVLDHWWWEHVIFDLGSTELDGTVPMLINHDPNQRAGFGAMRVNDNQLLVSGQILSNEHGQGVAAESDDGFPWQMSVFIEPAEIVELKAGADDVVNGKTISGPMTIFRQNTIREISFCPVGVDANTTAAVMSRQSRKANQSSKQNQPKRKEVNKMGARLADFLNNEIGDGDDRSDIIDNMASEAGIEPDTVNDILNATINCPPIERLRGFSRALDISLQSIVDAAKEDGCDYEGFMAKERKKNSQTGDEKAVILSERERIKAILNDDESTGREQLALSLAMDTDMEPEQAKKILAAAPKASGKAAAGNQFANLMKAIGNPTVGADPGESTEMEESQAIQAGWANAFGHRPN